VSDPPSRETIDSDHLVEYRSCIVCGSPRLSVVASAAEMAEEAEQRERLFRELFPRGTPDYMLKDRAYPTQTYRARLLKCGECGTLARDPHLSARGCVAEYAHDEYHAAWLESSHREFHAAFAERMPELVRWVGPEAHVLEIGSFVGGFLAAATDAGWRAEGIDVGRCVARFARSKGLEVHIADLTETHFPDRTFDAVFLWDCFDQLPRPWQQLEEIYRILADDGRLLLRVPNGEFVKCMQRAQHVLPPDMVRRVLAFTGLAAFPFQIGYTPASLSGMVQECAFERVRVRNRINVRGLSPIRASFWSLPAATRTLRLVHAASETLQLMTLGALTLGPWFELTCEKSGAVHVDDEALAQCTA
jgi:SAM-dependent methyltransferase